MDDIKIYNSLSRTKEDFETYEENHVKMYVCGPTVYNLLHVGNFRGPVFYNFLRNWLEKVGYKVTYVYNFTDVDDKIIAASIEQNITAKELSEKYIQEFKNDYAALQLGEHTHNPKVSEHMDEIINMISRLIDGENAYVIERNDGRKDVNYSVESFDGYGKLNNKNIEELLTGVRVEVDNSKKHPADFALWKSAKEGEPSWESPWGAGRPGWHIECSAMSEKYLGQQFDIHGGGLDLAFPHHENELAQSDACFKKSSVRYWVHNNMIQFGEQKMSKSLGNIVNLRDFLTNYDGEIYKYQILSVHYRSVLQFSDQQTAAAINSLAKFYSALSLATLKIQGTSSNKALITEFSKWSLVADKEISASLNDDFNTPILFAKLFEALKLFNKKVRLPGKVKPEQLATAYQYLEWMSKYGEVLSLFQQDPQSYLVSLDNRLLKQNSYTRAQVQDLVDQRRKARDDKDYAKSDELRDELLKMSILVSDSAEATTWEVMKN